MKSNNVLDQICEEATGCRANMADGGPMYDRTGRHLTDEQAADLFRDGQLIEVPNAGAGSFTTVLPRLGYQFVEPYETGSSAGDWTLCARENADADCWFVVHQTNRYPYHGFMYALGDIARETD